MIHCIDKGWMILDIIFLFLSFLFHIRKNMEELDSLHKHLKSKLTEEATTASSAAAASKQGASHHHGDTHSVTSRRNSESEQRAHQTGFSSQNGQRHADMEGRTGHEIESEDGYRHGDVQSFDERTREGSLTAKGLDTEMVHVLQSNIARGYSDTFDTHRNGYTDDDRR